MDPGINIITSGYSQLVRLFIRPYRSKYKNKALGPHKFQVGGMPVVREDFILKNSRKLEFVCTLYSPAPDVRRSKRLPTVIIGHGNGGCRLTGIAAVPLLLPYQIQVAVLDFAGSGLSQGLYVTMGWHESQDIKILSDYLLKRDIVSSMALWGYSMGSIASYLRAYVDKSLACIVLDSPYSRLLTLAQETAAAHAVYVPGFLINSALYFLRQTIKKTASVDISNLNLVALAPEMTVPCLFGHGKSDKFIGKHHSELLHSNYGGKSNIVLFKGTHESVRPQFWLDTVLIYFSQHLTFDDGTHPVLDPLIKTSDMTKNIDKMFLDRGQSTFSPTILKIMTAYWDKVDIDSLKFEEDIDFSKIITPQIIRDYEEFKNVMDMHTFDDEEIPQ